MAQSIYFRVKKWQYNDKTNQELSKTNLTYLISTLASKKTHKTEGLTFTWMLVISANEIEILYYSSEEWVVVNDVDITDDELLAIIKASFNKSNREVSILNLSAGLNASFPLFDKSTFDLLDIRQTLNTGR